MTSHTLSSLVIPEERGIAGQSASRIRNYTAAVRPGFSPAPLSRDILLLAPIPGSPTCIRLF
jgi:hypothetical protein